MISQGAMTSFLMIKRPKILEKSSGEFKAIAMIAERECMSL